jgi:hypothetical protein
MGQTNYLANSCAMTLRATFGSVNGMTDSP